MNREQFLEESRYYFLGSFLDLESDLSDEMWFQMLIDIAENQLDSCCEALGLTKPKDVTGRDIALYYVEQNSQDAKTSN